MGLLLKSLSRIDTSRPAAAIEPIEDSPHRATIREPSRGNMAPMASAVLVEFEASTVNVAVRQVSPATPLEIDTSTFCLTIPADEPFAPSSDAPISLEALFAVPFPSEATDGAAHPIAPAVALPPPSRPQTPHQTVPSDFATALDRLDQLQQTLADDLAHQETARHSPSSGITQATALAAPKLRPEFRELCDHLLSRFPLTKHCTLLVVDAGRSPLDHSWLLPLAAGLLDSIANRQARALLVEVDPCASGIAQMLGIDATSHSADGASDTAAFSNTYHPQIDILRLGASSLAAVKTRLEETWTELQESYNLILVASGPLAGDTSGRASNLNQIVGSLLHLADAVILSVELSSTPVSVARETAELLKAAGANLLGCTVQAAEAAE
jgi:Mrp family chromosome partitioning ATPase